MSKNDFNSFLNDASTSTKGQSISLKRLKTLDELEKIENENKISKEKIDKFISKIRRNFFVGFGFGLIIAAIAFWIFGSNNQNLNNTSLEEKYTDAKLIERAKELGMVFPNEEVDEEVDLSGVME